jgi:hypothetical protein
MSTGTHKEDVRIELQRETEDRAIAEWRRAQLLESGFVPALAAKLADDGRYDLHALIELVERGCPPELAARVVAPADEERPV